jgi:glycosyltransferase involved in cell wall biosynthesis
VVRDAASIDRLTVDASIVIPCYNAEETIDAALTRILDQAMGRSVEVLVCDNGSTDRTLEVVRAIPAGDTPLHVVDASAERGAAAARNSGARAAVGRLLVFVDADDLVGPGWLDGLLNAPRGEAILAGAVDEWSLARFPTWRASSTPFRPPTTIRGRVFAISANCAVPRSLFLGLGGFQSNCGGGVGEDVDLSWRAQELGYPIHFVADSLVLKRPRATRRGLFVQWANYGRSAAVLSRRFVEPADPPSARRQDAVTPAGTVREVLSCLAHPIRNQGVFIQGLGLAWGWGDEELRRLLRRRRRRAWLPLPRAPGRSSP